jgi:hypothetical protein
MANVEPDGDGRAIPLKSDSPETKIDLAADVGDADIADDITAFRNDLRRQAILALLIGLGTIALGILIIAISHRRYSILTEFDGEIVRDVGISVVIAGLLGGFYEIFIKWTGRAEAKVRMEKSTRRLLKMGSNVESLVTQVAGGDDPVLLIRRMLELRLSPNRKYEPVITNVEKLLREIFCIHSLGNRLQAKEIEEYVALIAWILEKYTVRSATASRKILEGMLDGGDTFCEYSPFELRVFTLQILSTQMKAMRKGDSYDSLANIWLYTNMSQHYILNTHQALSSGVGIRRIFNLCNEQSTNRAQNFDSALDLVRKHIIEFNEPGFQYRFLIRSSLKKLDQNIIHNAGIINAENVESMYFGHFYHTKDKKMLRFDSKNGSKMTGLNVTTFSTGNISPDFEAKTVLFEHFWNIAETTLPGLISRV